MCLKKTSDEVLLFGLWKVLLATWLVTVLALPQALVAQTALSDGRVAAVDQAIELQMQQQEAVGAAIGIILDGEVVYTNGYGWADRDEQIPVTTETMFRWASVSKPITAISAMQLVDQGKLDLHKDICEYVEEFPAQSNTITSRDLMCHQGGIVHYRNGKVIRTKREYEMENPYQDVVLALDRFKESPLVNAPGEKMSYSTHGYMLLSAVVQKAGEAPFYQQVQERICKPLGLESLQPDYQWVEIDHRAVGYRKFQDKVIRSTNSDVSWKLGGGGFISNIQDMARLACGLINGELLSQEAYQTMWTPQDTADGTKTNSGLGFFLADVDGSLQVSHNGSQEKTRTRLVIFPDDKFGVVFMSNSEYVDPGRFTTAVRQALQND